MVFMLIMAALVILLFLVAVSFVRIHLHYEKEGADDRLMVRITWLRYFSHTVSIPAANLQARLKQPSTIKVETESLRAEVSLLLMLRTVLHYLGRLHRGFRYAAGHSKIKKLEWCSEFGTADAAHTGLIAGLAWSLKSAALTAVSAYSHLETMPRIHVRPHFRKVFFCTLFDCIFEIRIGHIMIAGLKTVRAR